MVLKTCVICQNINTRWATLIRKVHWCSCQQVCLSDGIRNSDVWVLILDFFCPCKWTSNFNRRDSEFRKSKIICDFFLHCCSSDEMATLQCYQGYLVEAWSFPQTVEKINSPSFKKSGYSCPDMSHICNILHMSMRMWFIKNTDVLTRHSFIIRNLSHNGISPKEKQTYRHTWPE